MYDNWCTTCIAIKQIATTWLYYQNITFSWSWNPSLWFLHQIILYIVFLPMIFCAYSTIYHNDFWLTAAGKKKQTGWSITFVFNKQL